MQCKYISYADETVMNVNHVFLSFAGYSSVHMRETQIGRQWQKQQDETI